MTDEALNAATLTESDHLRSGLYWGRRLALVGYGGMFDGDGRMAQMMTPLTTQRPLDQMIQGFLLEQYGTEVSPDFISSVTDEIMAEVTA